LRAALTNVRFSVGAIPYYYFTTSIHSISRATVDLRITAFVKPFANSLCDASCQSLLSNVEALLGMGKVPRLAMDGTGGAYFLNSNPKSVVAVWLLNIDGVLE
jgi:hypothetical protein